MRIPSYGPLGPGPRMILALALAPPLGLLVVLLALRLVLRPEVTNYGDVGRLEFEIRTLALMLAFATPVAYLATILFGIAGAILIGARGRTRPRWVAGMGAVGGACVMMIVSYELGARSWGPMAAWMAFGAVPGAITGWLFWWIGLREGVPRRPGGG